MPLFIPVPTSLPETDINQYIPLLLSAVEGFLQLPDVWAEADYAVGFQYMEALKAWLVENIPMTGQTPIGMLAHFASTNPVMPSGWLWCNGAEISRTTYAKLFAAIGTTYGIGDGTTTFNVPHLLGRYIKTSVIISSPALGDKAGALNHTLSVAELPAHHHAQKGFAAGATTPVQNIGGGRTGSITTLNDTADTGSGSAFSIEPLNITFSTGIYAGI